MIKVQKRDHRIVDYHPKKIHLAVKSAMEDTIGGIDEATATRVMVDVDRQIFSKYDETVTVEQIQDIVEDVLLDTDRKDVAKQYIAYRHNKQSARNKSGDQFQYIDDEFFSQYKHDTNPITTQLGNFVYTRTYSRYLPAEMRREKWYETVRRAVEYNCRLAPTPKEEAQKLFDNIFNLKQFPSGRTLWVGNTPVAATNPMSNFNCSFTVIDNYETFKDIFYLLMLGSGVGFRILFSDVAKLPAIRNKVNIVHEDYNHDPDKKDITTLEVISNETVKLIVGDSKEGWSQAIEHYFKLLYNHEYRNVKTIIINYNYVRPKGEKLQTFGGTASGHESLRKMFTKIDRVLKTGGEGPLVKLRPIHCLDMANIIAENVVSGGVRRSSEIALIDPADTECIQAKNDLYVQIDGKFELNPEISHRQMSNNSIFYKDKPKREQLHWNFEQLKLSGDPAFINGSAMETRRANANGCNPCITGDTEIAVADGRHSVPIKQLVDEEKDVPVYCKDNNGNTTISMLRHPRVTGTDKDVFEVEFDDGSIVKGTSNHKFLMKDGSKKPISKLNKGDSVQIASKWQINGNYKKSNYWHMRPTRKTMPEHRLIYENLHGITLDKTDAVHHINGDGLDNRIENLELMSQTEHNKFHDINGENNPQRKWISTLSNDEFKEYCKQLSIQSTGENNPRCIPISNEEYYNIMVEFATSQQKPITMVEWMDYAKQQGLPQSSSNYRGKICNLITKANIDAGHISKSFENGMRKAIYRKYLDLLHTSDLPVSFENNSIFVTKRCEYCGSEFKTPYGFREKAHCSNECGIKLRVEKGRKTKAEKAEQRHVQLLDSVIEGFAKYVVSNKTVPTYSDIIDIIHEAGAHEFRSFGMISYQNILDEIANRYGTPISSKKIKWNKDNYRESMTTTLLNNGMEYDHKVVDVRYIGKETVYNGTVDKYHNFGIMLRDSTTAGGMPKKTMAFAEQCGEIILDSDQQCNLSTVNVFAFVQEDGTLDRDGLHEAQYLSARMNFRMTCINLELPKWNTMHKRDRLMGCSLTGWQDMVNATDMSKEEEARLMHELKVIAHKVKKDYAAELGVNEPILATTVKPEGTLSLIPSVSAGVHYSHSPYYIRRVRISASDPLCKVCETLNYPVYPEVGQDWDTCVTKYIEFPVRAPEGRTKYDVSALEQLENYKRFMDYYVDHNCSITVSVREHEWDDVEQWMWDNWDTAVGVTFLSLDEHFHEAMPYEAISKEEYERRCDEMAPFIQSLLSKYETEETELDLGNESCATGACPVR